MEILDRLIECPKCGSNVCYEQHIDSETTWTCMGCGYGTSTLSVEGSETVTKVIETAPELYKDIKHVDSQNRVWFPITITLPEKGMVFVDGTSKDDWKWAAARVVELSQKERQSGKYPKGQKSRVDTSSMRFFERTDFIGACEYVGIFDTV